MCTKTLHQSCSKCSKTVHQVSCAPECCALGRRRSHHSAELIICSFSSNPEFVPTLLLANVHRAVFGANVVCNECIRRKKTVKVRTGKLIFFRQHWFFSGGSVREAVLVVVRRKFNVRRRRQRGSPATRRSSPTLPPRLQSHSTKIRNTIGNFALLPLKELLPLSCLTNLTATRRDKFQLILYWRLSKQIRM